MVQSRGVVAVLVALLAVAVVVTAIHPKPSIPARMRLRAKQMQATQGTLAVPVEADVVEADTSTDDEEEADSDANAVEQQDNTIVVDADTTVEKEGEGEPAMPTAVTALPEVDANAEAAATAALAETSEGLLSWWGPSPATVARLDAGGEQAWADARRRLSLFGEDVNDLDASRFAEARVSAGVAAQLSAQLKVQADRRARAAERRRLSLRSESGAATSAQVLQTTCNGMVAAIRAYHRGNGAYPANAGIIRPGVRVAVATSTDNEINALFPVIMYRASALNSWNGVCDAAALQSGVDAGARTAAPVAVRTQNFAMGLEEEMNDMRLNPTVLNPGDDDDKTAIMSSGNVPAPRVSPYLKLAPDHTTAPTGYPHGIFAIVEAITGPAPIHWNSRATHRAAVDRFAAQAPNPWPWQAEGAQRTFTQLCTTYNNALPNPPGNNYAFNLGNARPDHAGFHVTKYPNNNMPYNSVQVNFETSLCSVYASGGFLALNVLPAQRNLYSAARATAAAFIANGAGMGLGLPGVRAQAIAGLPGQQLCELRGLLTTVVLRSLFWGTYEATVAKYGAYASGEPRNSQHVYGGTAKNFYATMPKSVTGDIVDLLEFPLSDVVHSLYTAYMANQAGIEGVLHGMLVAALGAVNGAPYTGNVVVNSNPAPVALTAAAVPWLAVNGQYFRRSMQALQGTAAGAASDGWVAHPPAGCYENPGALAERQVVMVMEARFQDEPLQRAMTSQMAPLPNPNPNGYTQQQYAQSLVTGLLNAVDNYVNIGANPPAMPPP